MKEFLKIFSWNCLVALTVVTAVIAAVTVLPFAANLLFNFETFDAKVAVTFIASLSVFLVCFSVLIYTNNKDK